LSDFHQDPPSESIPETTHSHLSIYELIPRVMADIGAVAKSGASGVPYQFRGIEQVMNALHPAMVKHGVFILPAKVITVRDDRLGPKQAHMVMLTMGYRIYGPRGDYVEVEGVGESVDYSDKASNQAMSMAYKYAILEAFCITTEDQQDGDRHSPQIDYAPPPQNNYRQQNQGNQKRGTPQHTAKRAQEKSGNNPLAQPPLETLIRQLDAQRSERLTEQITNANMPLTPDGRTPGMDNQIRRWVNSLLEEQKQGEPF
jgi:hypothetical protein